MSFILNFRRGPEIGRGYLLSEGIFSNDQKAITINPTKNYYYRKTISDAC